MVEAELGAGDQTKSTGEQPCRWGSGFPQSPTAEVHFPALLLTSWLNLANHSVYLPLSLLICSGVGWGINNVRVMVTR